MHKMLAIWFGLIFCAKLVFCVEDAGAVSFLVSDSDSICIFCTHNQTKTCLVDAIPTVRRKAVDFHFKRGEIYRAYGIKGARSVLIERQTLDLNSTVNKIIVKMDKVETSTDGLIEVEDLFVDWIHDKIYIIVNTTIASTLMRIDIPEPSSNSTVEPTVILSRDDVAQEAGVAGHTMVLKRVEVDPYEGTIYIVGKDYPNPPYVSTTTVCRAKLNGSNLEKLIRKASHGFIHVNFNDRNLYTLVTAKWYNIKNETGIECNINVYEIPKYQSFANSYNIYEMNPLLHFCFQGGYNFSREMFEFDKNLYIFTGDKIRSYLVEGDQFNTLDLKEEFSLSLDNANGVRTLKVLDPRVQRRKQEGHYLCDRTDCAGGCEVHPKTGDTCLP